MSSFFAGWLMHKTALDSGSRRGGCTHICNGTFLVVLAVFLLFIIRPQQQQQKDRNMMLSALRRVTLHHGRDVNGAPSSPGHMPHSQTRSSSNDAVRKQR